MSQSNIHKEIYKGYLIKISTDEDPITPRENDNLGKIWCHSKYTLGDKNLNDFNTPEKAQEYFKEHDCVWLPLYLYDHGGITISTTGFSCPWDSGQVGYVYIERAIINKECPERTDNEIKESLNDEIKIYDKFLKGEFVGFEIIELITCDKCGHIEEKETDSCWGFDDEDYALKEAKDIIDNIVKNEK